MDGNFRQQDDEALRGVCGALARLCLGHAPEWPATRLAAFMATGGNDPFGCEASTFYKFADYTRRIPLHKLWRLACLTGDYGVIEELARQHGGVFYPLPKASPKSAAEMRDVIRRVSTYLDDICSAQAPDSDGGEAITPKEFPQLEHDANAVIAACLTLLETCKGPRG